MTKNRDVDMQSVADFICKGLGLTEFTGKAKLEAVPDGTCCAITGEPITHGYRAQKVVSANTGEFLDLLSGDITGYLSESAARAFKGSWNMGSRLFFEDGTSYHPLISCESADKQCRACWSQLIRDVWPARAGQRMVAIIATDFKKKVWPLAQVGVLGNSTPVLVFDNSREFMETTSVDWALMIEILDRVEELYSLGYSKYAIEYNLFDNYNIAREIGLDYTMEAELELEFFRNYAEFKPVIVVAQKHA